jgi:CDP-6-deoxy-D-xylo-4-hexulose-3-dehydrase
MQRSGLEVKVPTNKQFYVEGTAEAVEEIVRKGQWAYGEYNERFAESLRKYIGVRYALLTNSGSSASLLAVSALKSPLLGDRALKDGDKVAIPALSFPTTVNAIILNNLVPVFLDINPRDLNVDADQLIGVIRTEGVRAVVLTHTLGNPFPAHQVRDLCKESNVWFIEDNADALGSEINGKKTGGFGDISIFSFYPAHMISTGEGGALGTNRPILARIIQSYQNWGRDCFCPPGFDNTCGKRFGHEFENLPFGYDHKYVIRHIGYNLKMTNIQACLGFYQMLKIDWVVKERQKNWNRIDKIFDDYPESFGLQKVEYPNLSSWFGYYIDVVSGYFDKQELVYSFEENGIATRALFAGNVTRHPAYKDIKYEIPYVCGLKHTDIAMNMGFWIGCYPGMEDWQFEHIEKTLDNFMEKYV